MDLEAANLRLWSAEKRDSVRVLAARLPTAGSYEVSITVNGEGDYEYFLLDIDRVPGSSTLGASLAPSGQVAFVETGADTTNWYALIPDAVFPGVSPIDYPEWGVRPGLHRILMTKDSVYHVCRLPCEQLTPITLQPRHVIQIGRTPGR
jgi:hypothetical protein